MDKSAIYLITKADDIGSNASANQAFMQAYEKGILRNGDIMMTCDKAQEAASYFKNQPGFCMGLHLTMNAAWDNVRWGPVLPAEQVPSLVDKDGYFFKTTQQLQQNNPCLKELMAEVQAQYEAALAQGLRIRFLDIHMGFTYAVEGASAAIAAFTQKNNLIDVERFTTLRVERSEHVDSVEAAMAVLENLQPGVYYYKMGHPAVNTPEMRDLSQYGKITQQIALERERDLQVAVDERMLQFIKKKNIVLLTVEQAASL